jgi:hypothetical protein
MIDALCKYSFGVALELGYSSCFLGFGSEAFCFLQNAEHGKNKCCAFWEKPLEQGKLGLGGHKSSAKRTYFFIIFVL